MAMRRLASAIRSILGLAMVAAGVSLAVPLGRVAVEGWAAMPAAGSTMVVPGTTLPESPSPALPGAANQASMPPAPREWMVPEDQLPPSLPPRTDYAPPPAPDRLPQVAPAFTAEGPGMNATYRSTLAVPPPPLLDAQSPPPAAASWAAPEPARPAPVPPAVPHDAPPSYVVRVGDDLTAIATRFYGHPGAAGSVWAANRDVIPDPNLLPIGAELRLPPPWSVEGMPTASRGAGRTIEPPRVMAPPPQPIAQPVASPSSGWIDSRQPGPAAVVPRRAVATGTVRVAPGETLESLAERFYGDRSAAARIWEANRDRLRSPELVVTGMELRLP
jgi:nucleoid-associated protein YgaU